MVVHLGEAQVFERHVAQAVQSVVHIHRAGAHLLEQLPKLLFVHRERITGLRSGAESPAQAGGLPH